MHLDFVCISRCISRFKRKINEVHKTKNINRFGPYEAVGTRVHTRG